MLAGVTLGAGVGGSSGWHPALAAGRPGSNRSVLAASARVAELSERAAALADRTSALVAAAGRGSMAAVFEKGDRVRVVSSNTAWGWGLPAGSSALQVIVCRFTVQNHFIATDSADALEKQPTQKHVPLCHMHLPILAVSSSGFNPWWLSSPTANCAGVPRQQGRLQQQQAGGGAGGGGDRDAGRPSRPLDRPVRHRAHHLC